MGELSEGCADFERHVPLIDDVTAYVCRRQCLRGADAEDFASSVKVHFLVDDCAALRGFEGRSKLSTYLTTVVLNLARDERIRRQGRWRPSAAAQRLGTVAVQLETLTLRDGRSFRDAAEILRSHYDVDLPVAALADLAGKLPPRTRRRFEGGEGLERLWAAETTESRVEAAEHERVLADGERALASALEELDVEDRLILRLRMRDGLKINQVARTLGLEPKSLYPRLSRCLAKLREGLEARGVKATELLDSLGWAGSDFKVDFSLASAREPWDGPSNRMRDE